MAKKRAIFRFINGGYSVQKALPCNLYPLVPSISKEAEHRLRWFDYYYSHGKNAALTCRYFGISRKTFYKWLKPYRVKKNSCCLESKSKKPKQFRTSKMHIEFGKQVRHVRTQYPTWSKYKIGAYLRQQGLDISDSSVGYILKKKGLINQNLSKKRKRSYKKSLNIIRIRNANIRIDKPGALVQVDTKEFYMPGGAKAIQFTAVDCYSRKRKLKGYTRKTAFCGKDFLHEVQDAFPFKIQAILTDNGSEFKAEFDEECKKLGIPHYWTSPNSPDQNAFVESSHSIDQKEFYEVFYIEPSLSGFNLALKEWENLYNNIRPHGSLKFLAPNQFLRYYFEKQKVLPML